MESGEVIEKCRARQMESGEVIEKCRAHYLLIEEWEKELESLKEQEKDIKKRIDGKQGEIRQLIKVGAAPQVEMPLGKPDSEAEPECVPGHEHDWQPMSGAPEADPPIFRDACANCHLMRQRNFETEPWGYIWPELETSEQPEPDPLEDEALS